VGLGGGVGASYHWGMEPIAKIFARHGVRCTKPRATIYFALASTKSHPTAEELFQSARGAVPGLSLATVYNTLEVLCRRGLARKVTGLHAQDSAARYDADLSPHVHFVSDEGTVRDVPADLSERLVHSLPADLIEDLERRLGVRVDRVSIELVGKTTGGGPC
jgi:Fe2+ or Zn2+ uptake regulation protein